MKTILFIAAIFLFTILSKCKIRIKETPIHTNTNYNLNKLNLANDTLLFPNDGLKANKYNYYFQEVMGKRYLIFPDKIRKEITYYNIDTKIIDFKVSLKNLNQIKRLGNFSAFTVNKDSIFIGDRYTLFLINSHGDLKKIIDLSSTKIILMPFTNVTPGLISNNTLYAPAYPYRYLMTNDLHISLPILYKINLATNKVSFTYQLPESYLSYKHSKQSLFYFYCITNQDFLFSFPFDSCIYLTNFYQSNIRLDAKGKFVNSFNSTNNNSSYLKEYYFTDSYGPIYYDKYKGRYLRLVHRKINQDVKISKDLRKSATVVIMDSKFNIIGESIIPYSLNPFNLLILKEGIFVQVIDNKSDLTFLKLTYSN